MSGSTLLSPMSGRTTPRRGPVATQRATPRRADTARLRVTPWARREDCRGTSPHGAAGSTADTTVRAPTPAG
jgi:hypothetical protein